MKKQFLRFVVMSSFVIALATAGQAQITGRIIADIPFDFTVGRATLPAGSYAVARANTQGALRISSLQGRAGVFTITHGGRSSDKPSQAKLVFRRYGNEYFLAEVWDEGSTAAIELPRSRAEREIAEATKRLAQHAVEREVVLIAAR